jgi:hypothetical protein
MLKKSQAELEYTSITACSTMKNPSPAVLLTDGAQIDDPNGGAASRYQQTRETWRLRDMGGVQREAAPVLVCKKGVDPEALRIQVTGLVC